MNTFALPAGFWNFAGSEPEYAACSSRLHMLNGDPARTARCDVLHDETGETRHSAWVNGVRVSWSDADDVIAAAWLWILPACAHCGARYRKADSGCGPYCRTTCQLADKHSPADDYEAEEAA